MKEINYINEFASGIRQEEIDFPKRFASYEEKKYGILFYMTDNKDSYDGNHACIYPENKQNHTSECDSSEVFLCYQYSHR